MEITIGVRDISRELSLEVSDEPDALATKVAETLAKAADGDGGAVLDLTDTKGNRLLVPAAQLAYVQLGASEPRRVGFGSI